MSIIDDNILKIKRLQLGSFGTNSYIIKCQKTQKGVLIDAPAEANKILRQLEGIDLNYIFLTHDHSDHVGALSELREKLGVPLAAHPLDAGSLPSQMETSLSDGDILTIGELKIKVLHTPGHTPGSLCFLLSDYLFSGDTLFPGGPGKTWSPSDFKNIINSITTKIFVLHEDTKIYPGHGDSTTISEEKKKFDIFSSKAHDPNLYGDVLWV